MVAPGGEGGRWVVESKLVLVERERFLVETENGKWREDRAEEKKQRKKTKHCSLWFFSALWKKNREGRMKSVFGFAVNLSQ